MDHFWFPQDQIHLFAAAGMLPAQFKKKKSMHTKSKDFIQREFKQFSQLSCLGRGRQCSEGSPQKEVCNGCLEIFNPRGWG
jgi:hypothetical protein